MTAGAFRTPRMKLSKQNAPIYPRQTVAQAFVALLEQHLFYLHLWEPAARSRDDIEGVHQLRVGLRRMRSALRVFQSAIPNEITGPWAEEMRYLAGQLGPARDLDVFLSEGLGSVAGKLPLPGESALRQVAERQCAAAYETVVAMLDGDRYGDFKRGFADWLAGAGWERGSLEDKHRRRLAQIIPRFARRRLNKQLKRVLEQGRSANWKVAGELHQLRIECKKLRYAGEFFNPLFDGMHAFIDHLKELQDMLGVLNDVAMTRTLLEHLLADTEDAEAHRYAAGLIGWRCCEAYHLQDRLRGQWRDFVEIGKPW